jgi:hypothetical protein
VATKDEIDAASRDSRLTLLKQIQTSASAATVASNLDRLAYAYAVTVGTAPGKLPGAPTHTATS